MSPSYSPPPPPPTHYPYYSPPPPPPPDCNMTKPKNPPPPPPPPPPHPPPPPVTYNCTCPPLPLPLPPPPNRPYYLPAPPPNNYVVEHDYKAVIAVSVSLGGFLVAFLLLGVLFLAKLKKKYSSPPTTPPTNEYAPADPQQTVITAYEVIQIQEAGDVVDDAAAACAPSYEPAPVAHDHGHHNY